MFKNALVYRIAHWDPAAAAELENRLDAERFVECGATQPESAGWVEPRGEKHAPLVENVGGQLLLRLCVERRAVPGSVVKAELEARLDRVELETGRRPRGKRAKELKEDIVQALLPRAFPKRSGTLVWIDARVGLVLIEAASLKKADALVTRLVALLGAGVQLSLLQTQLAPVTAMSEWLRSREAPAGFTLDRECELKQPDSEKATIKYARHALDIDEVGAHIEQGKLPTQLAMTWQGRVSFVLTEAMTLKKIKLLDGVLEQAGPGKDDNSFDADMAITTAELGGLIPDLLDALGGEPSQQPLAAGTPGVLPSTPAANDTRLPDAA